MVAMRKTGANSMQGNDAGLTLTLTLSGCQSVSQSGDPGSLPVAACGTLAGSASLSGRADAMAIRQPYIIRFVVATLDSAVSLTTLHELGRLLMNQCCRNNNVICQCYSLYEVRSALQYAPML